MNPAEPSAAPDGVRADHFDGLRSRPRRAWVSLDNGAVKLEIAPDGSDDGDTPPQAIPLRDIVWPERTRHGVRIAQLPGGASLQAIDAAEWDAWAAAHVRRGSLVERAQQSWRGTLAALAVLLAVLGAGYLWGLPLAARGVVALVPVSVDQLLGEQALRSLDGQLLRPSRLPDTEQARIRAAFARAVAATHGPQAPVWQLEFRSSRVDTQSKSRLGPNAFALPGGTMVMTDELVELVKDDEAVLGVLGHELGHVRQRHGMRQLVQVSVLGALGSIAFGDYSTLISSAPLLLATLGYSRDAEREADEEAIRLMKASGISPLAMVRFFEKMSADRARSAGKNGEAIGIAISTHPGDAERVERFRRAAYN